MAEIEPTPTGGNIVWQWRAWDHLVQDHDPTAPNHGDPAKHPERLDLNADAALPLDSVHSITPSPRPEASSLATRSPKPEA